MIVVQTKKCRFYFAILLTILFSFSCNSQNKSQLSKETEDPKFPIEKSFNCGKVICSKPKEYHLYFDSLGHMEVGYFNTIDPYTLTLENANIKFAKKYEIKISSYIERDDLFINLVKDGNIYSLEINQSTNHPISDILYFKKNNSEELSLIRVERVQSTTTCPYSNHRINGSYVDLATMAITDISCYEYPTDDSVINLFFKDKKEIFFKDVIKSDINVRQAHFFIANVTSSEFDEKLTFRIPFVSGKEPSKFTLNKIDNKLEFCAIHQYYGESDVFELIYDKFKRDWKLEKAIHIDWQDDKIIDISPYVIDSTIRIYNYFDVGLMKIGPKYEIKQKIIL